MSQVQVESEMIEEAGGSWHKLWAFAAALLGVCGLAVLSIVIAALPEREREVLALGLAFGATVIFVTGWLEQDRSLQRSVVHTVVSTMLALSVLDGVKGARYADDFLGMLGASFVWAIALFL